jgi:hypothetical protein
VRALCIQVRLLYDPYRLALRMIEQVDLVVLSRCSMIV